ncbi:IclR family transcriptional regulator (plasmid) [Haloferacaceae archaeon DSL9]
MSELPKEAKYPVKATRVTIRLLETLRDLEGARVTELANELDYPKSSVHNYLSTLQEQGYVVKRGNEYHLGLQFLELGSFARHQRRIYEVARPEVTSLAQETGELANLLVEEHGQGVYIYRESGHKAVKVDSYTGQRVHLHNTALGKAILAHTPREYVDRIIGKHGLPKTTEKTVTDRDELYRNLDEIRERGIAFDDEERLNGLRCVAAPIRNKNDRVEGAISVAGPSSRFTDDRFEKEIPELVRNAVNIIELNITYG